MPVVELGRRTVTLGRPPEAAAAGLKLGVTPDKMGVTVDLQKVAYTLDGEQVTAERPVQVVGLAWKCKRTKGELMPLAEFVTGPMSTYRMNLEPCHSVAGHLLAAGLGGPNDPANLASISQAFNDQMKGPEKAIADACAAGPRRVQINLNYHDDTDRAWVPKEVTYTFQGADDQTKTGHATQTLLAMTAVIAHSGAWTADLHKAAEQMVKEGFQVEKFMCLPGDSVPLPGRRPYAVLDYIALVHDGRYGAVAFGNGYQTYKYLCTIRDGGAFAEHRPKGWFRAVLLVANAAGHGTRLESDAYGNRDSYIELKDGIVAEGHQGLIVGGGANAPEIDHIVPESAGGANCFANAQLTSKSYNAAKGQRTQTLKLLSEKEKLERKAAAYDWLKKNNPVEYQKLVERKLL